LRIAGSREFLLKVLKARATIWRGMRVRGLSAAVFVLVAGIAAGSAVASSPATATLPARAGHELCSSGYVDATINGEKKCLRAGEFCSAPAELQYEHYGFTCVNGHLQSYHGQATPPTTTTPTTSGVGKTVRLRARTRTSGCKLAPTPDRRCSRGAYYTGLTKVVICSSSFRTSTIRNVPESEKHAVEAEYGMTPKSYGHTLEIDHIVSLELGGSNDIANLYPEKAPGYHLKDKLENKLHGLVCSGAMTLRTVQRGIASNWEKLYKKVFGTSPEV
jgi:hypothetical protein